MLHAVVQIVRDKCFAKCITVPGRSLSGGEQQCLQRCVDRYGDVRPSRLCRWQCQAALQLKHVAHERVCMLRWGRQRLLRVSLTGWRVQNIVFSAERHSVESQVTSSHQQRVCR